MSQSVIGAVLDGGLRRWSRFVAELSRLDHAALLERLRVPHLLLWTPLDAGEERIVFEQFSTTVALPDGPDRPVREPWAVAALEKRSSSNAFDLMITLGRAPNNDLVLPHPRISKFHAYVRLQGDAWQLVDVGSTNGTRLDELELVPHRPVELRSGSQLRLAGGSLCLEAVWPCDLLDLLMSGRPAPNPLGSG